MLINAQCYDFFDYFDREIEIIWMTKWTMTKFMYVLTRYSAFVEAGVVIYRKSNPRLPLPYLPTAAHWSLPQNCPFPEIGTMNAPFPSRLTHVSPLEATVAPFSRAYLCTNITGLFVFGLGVGESMNYWQIYTL